VAYARLCCAEATCTIFGRLVDVVLALRMS
jgi:hypothetical protein